jgi:hypothetical protein
MSEARKPLNLSDPASVVLASLDDLLDRERSALLDGDLDAVSRSLREKERLIDALNGIRPAGEDILGAIRDKVQRNQVLLDGALDGIRAVADRMSALRRIRETLETYDQSGHRTVIEGLRKGRVEKRA